MDGPLPDFFNGEGFVIIFDSSESIFFCPVEKQKKAFFVFILTTCAFLSFAHPSGGQLLHARLRASIQFLMGGS
jgi:hypothetical protein